MQTVFFSCIVYDSPYHIISRKPFSLHPDCEVLLVTGIANPKAIKHYIELRVKSYLEKNYSDHHIFTIDDLQEMKERFRQLQGAENIIITTEKDAVRLLKFRNELAHFPLYVLPVQHQVKFGEAEKFKQIVLRFIQSFNRSAIS